MTIIGETIKHMILKSPSSRLSIVNLLADFILNNFTELMHSKGTMVGDDAILEDAVAMAGVSKFPARIKCALLGWMAYKDAVVQAQAKL